MGGSSADASFSSVRVRSVKGLLGCGESISLSLLTGDSALAGVLLPVPGRDPADTCLVASNRCSPVDGTRALADLVCDMVAFGATDDIEDCRFVREAGTAGGGIEALCAETPRDVLGLVPPVDGTLGALDGVPVRDAVALDAALRGFVGDFAGDLVIPLIPPILGGRVFGTGLGLGAFKLLLLLRAGSATLPLAAPGLKLVGRIGFFTVEGRATGAGAGWAIILAIMGLTNMP